MIFGDTQTDKHFIILSSVPFFISQYWNCKGHQSSYIYWKIRFGSWDEWALFHSKPFPIKEIIFSLNFSKYFNYCVIPTTIFELARRFYNSYNYISFSEKNEIFPTFVWYLVGSGDYPRQSDNLYKFVVSKSLSLRPHWTNLNWMVHYTPQKTIFEHYIPPFQS